MEEVSGNITISMDIYEANTLVLHVNNYKALVFKKILKDLYKYDLQQVNTKQLICYIELYLARFNLTTGILSTLSDPDHKAHTTSGHNMTSKVIFRSSPIKYSNIDLSPNELLIISNSVLISLRSYL